MSRSPHDTVSPSHLHYQCRIMQQCTPLEAQVIRGHPQDTLGDNSNNVVQADAPPPHHSHIDLPSNDQQDGGQSLEEVCRELHSKVIKFLERETEDQVLRDVQEQTKTALGVIQDALARYSIEQLCFSYNGGKDCLVLLIVYLVGLYAHLRPTAEAPSSSARRNAATSAGLEDNTKSHNTSASYTQPAITSVPSAGTSSNGDSASASRNGFTAFPEQLTSIYIQPQHPFPEVTSFVASSSAYYHLKLVASSLPMKEAFAEYLAQHQEVEAIFVGTRRTDPHGGSLTFFDETDRGWPKFMRIHPVIDWHYREIWAFIRCLDIPYCSLYDLGYTSLGGTNDTHPNPKLVVDGSASTSAEISQAGLERAEATTTRYRPAYELVEDDEERLGRDH